MTVSGGLWRTGDQAGGKNLQNKQINKVETRQLRMQITTQRAPISVIYSPVGNGFAGGGLINSDKALGEQLCVLQEDEGEGTDRRKRRREGECNGERSE